MSVSPCSCGGCSYPSPGIANIEIEVTFTSDQIPEGEELVYVTGWICPLCDHGTSPYVDICSCEN